MAYEFSSSSSQFLRAESFASLSFPFTISCQFNPKNITQNMVLAAISDAGGGNRCVMVLGGALAGDPVRIDVLGAGAADSTVGFTSNAWQHACGVWSSTTSRTVYLNGSNSSTSTASVVQQTINRVLIGMRTSNDVNGLFMEGFIAEVGIWNAALTAAEVASLADGMTCDKVRPQNLVFYAPLVRDLIDAKGGLTITNNNGATVANHPRVYA
jgi:hypothetical protein